MHYLLSLPPRVCFTNQINNFIDVKFKYAIHAIGVVVTKKNIQFPNYVNIFR